MIDWAQARDMTGGDEGLLAEVIEVFQQEAPSLLANMRDAIDSRDTKLLHRAAHTLKNSLVTLGASESGEVAYTLEKLARDGCLQGAEALYAALAAELPLICAELSRHP